MKTRTLLALLLAALGLQAGASLAEDRCRTLMAEGEKLRSDGLQPEDRRRGEDLIRQAKQACRLKGVSAEAMAEASLAAASLLPDQQSLDEIHSVIETLQFESPNSEILPKAMIELANVYFQLDRLEEGRQLAHQSLEERERIFGTDSREYIRGLAILGVFLATSDGGGPIRPNLEDGYRYVREGARRARELFGTGDPTTVSNLIHYRSVLDEMGRHDEAKALDEQILPYLDNIDEGW